MYSLQSQFLNLRCRSRHRRRRRRQQRRSFLDSVVVVVVDCVDFREFRDFVVDSMQNNGIAFECFFGGGFGVQRR